jgi:hypothetical protein
LKAGAFADLGTLILTNKRLIYIAKGGQSRAAAWAIGGVFAAQAIEQSVSKAEIDELATQQGSYYTPLQNITCVEAGKKMGQSYVRVDSAGTEKSVHAYVVGGGNNNQQWAAAINQAKTAIQTNPIQTTSHSSQHTQQVCPKCGAPDNLGSKFCTTCGSQLTQTRTEPPILPPPPSPPTQTPTCPYCRSPIRYIQQYERWYCDNERRYV